MLSCRSMPAGLTVVVGWVLLLSAGCQRTETATSRPSQLQRMSTKVGSEMVLIPAGTFQMGSRNGQEDESPVHEVRLDAFWMDRTEITQQQYGKLVKENPSHFKGQNRPMEMVSWPDAAIFCNKRSKDDGLEPCYDEATAQCNFAANGYRLPTEAEWEYACRAGGNGDYSFGEDARLLKDYAWFVDNASKQTQPVAQKKSNAWGLFDMCGNVAEWCNDIYGKTYYKAGLASKDNPRGPQEGEKYVLRGGAWNSSAKACRSAYRVGEDPGFQDACFARDAIGFRCVRKVVRQ